MSERGRSMQTHHLALSALSLSFVLLVWFVITETGLVSPRFLASPRAIVLELLKMLRDGYTGASLFLHFWASVRRTLVGYLLAVAVGVPLGLLLGSNRVSYYLVTPVMTLLRPIPPIAYIPLAILWFGLGNPPAFFLICLGGFFPVLMNTIAGVRSVDAIYLRAAQNLGAGEWTLFWRIMVPAAMPFILTGVRVGIGVAFICVIVAEMIAVNSGLGYRILEAREYFWSDKVIAGMITIGMVGLGIDLLMARLNRWLLRWHRGVDG